jgi:hypothetical protein
MALTPPQRFRKTENILRRGLAANRPAAADVIPGTLYFSTDKGTIERSSGSAWESYNGGLWTTVAYNAGDFTASPGTWTVDPGDLVVFSYTIIGKTMITSLVISAAATTGNPSELLVKIPGGFLPAQAQQLTLTGYMLFATSGTRTAAYALTTAGADKFRIAQLSGAALPNDDIYLWIQITTEIQ